LQLSENGKPRQDLCLHSLPVVLSYFINKYIIDDVAIARLMALRNMPTMPTQPTVHVAVGLLLLHLQLPPPATLLPNAPPVDCCFFFACQLPRTVVL